MPVPPSSHAATEADASSELHLLPGMQAVSAGAPTVSVDPPVRGEGLLRPLERGFLALDRLVARALPAAFNPVLGLPIHQHRRLDREGHSHKARKPRLPVRPRRRC